ncbi:hypothetical protein WJ15_13390 [Burkholderia cepacia]|nr:hypothetical protein WJ15_13390 [Burkholderia cepacia]
MEQRIGTSSSSTIVTVTADAIGQSMLLKNSSHITRPSISVFAPPSSSGITYSPTAGMSTSRLPATMPLRDNGSVMRQNADHGVAPRSFAASSSVRSIFTRCAYSGITMNGRYE